MTAACYCGASARCMTSYAVDGQAGIYTAAACGRLFMFRHWQEENYSDEIICKPNLLHIHLRGLRVPVLFLLKLIIMRISP